MSAPTDRRDKVWLCSGCAHGFMFTARVPISYAYILVGPDAEKGETPTRDIAHCLCSNPAMVSGLEGEQAGDTAATPRAKITTQVIVCDGFKLKDAPKDGAS